MIGLRDDALRKPGAHAHGAQAGEGKGSRGRSSASGGSISRSSARPRRTSASSCATPAPRWRTCRSRNWATRRRSTIARTRASPRLPVIDPASIEPPMRACGRAGEAARRRPDLCSKRWVWEQYDHLILGNTVQRPGGDAAVVRVKEGPKGLAMTTDVTPRYCEADPFEGGKQAVAETWRNLSAVGAKPLAVTDNLNFGNPERPEIMGQLVGCIQGIADRLQGARIPGRVRQRVALQRDQRPRDPADPEHRRRRADRRFRQLGQHRLQGRRRADRAARRDQGLDRPVDVPARDLRTRGGGAAAGRSQRRAAHRRFRARR